MKQPRLPGGVLAFEFVEDPVLDPDFLRQALLDIPRRVNGLGRCELCGRPTDGHRYCAGCEDHEVADMREDRAF